MLKKSNRSANIATEIERQNRTGVHYMGWVAPTISPGSGVEMRTSTLDPAFEVRTMQHRSDYLQSSTTSNELPIPITDQALSNDELKEVVTDSVNCLGYCSANTTINRLGARVFFGAGSDRQLLVPQLFDVPYSPEQISAASTQLERTKIASLTNTTAHTHVIQTFGLRVVNPVDPYADLRQFARNKLKLKGQQLAVVESLCDAGGELSIADLAHCEGVGWNNPKKQFEDLQRRLNPKIKPYGWRIERHDGAARLFKLPVEQPAKDP